MITWILAAPALAEDWTLAAAVAHALAHNLDLGQDALDTRSAEAGLRSAKADRGPSLAADLGVSGYTDPSNADAVDDGAGWSVGVSQPLPTGGTLWVGGSQDQSFARRLGADASVYSFSGVTVTQPLLDGAWGDAHYAADRARLSVEGARLAERDARERLVVDVANAYWELVAARESTRLAVRSVEIAEKQLADTKERFEEGFAGSGDVLQLERALGVARQSRVVAEAVEAGAARTLARRLGVSMERAVELTPVDRPDPPDTALDASEILADARANNTTYALVRLGVETARRDLAAGRVDALPDLDVSASVGVSATTGAAGALPALTQDPDAAWSVGIDLAVPLAWSGARAELEQSRLALARAELAAQAAEQDLAAAVYAAIDAVRRDRARVDLAEVTLKAAEAGLAADQELYREGRGSTRDVVRSLEVLEEAQVARLAAEIDLQAAWLNLARLRGRVLAEFGAG